MFSWADLTTPDVEASKKFYTQLLDLDFVEMPMGEMGAYVMLNKGGKNVCAMFQMDDSMKAQTGGHPFWQSYFTVDDADASTARAKDLGGNVILWGPSTSSTRDGCLCCKTLRAPFSAYGSPRPI